MPLLLAPIFVIIYAISIYYWHLDIGRIAIQTPWGALDEPTPIILFSVFIFGLMLIYLGLFLSWLMRLPALWRKWRLNHLLHKAIVMYQFGLYPKALVKIQMCLRFYPKNSALLYFKGLILSAMNQNTEAFITYASIKKYPLLKYHGMITWLRKDPLACHSVLKTAFKLLPQSPFLHNLIKKQNDYLTKFEDIIDYSPYVQDKRNQARAQIYLLKGRLTNTPKWLKKAWQYDPQNLSIFHYYLQSATSPKHALKITSKAYKAYHHPVIMKILLKQLNIQDPLAQYIYAKKHCNNAPEMSFLLSLLKTEIRDYLPKASPHI